MDHKRNTPACVLCVLMGILLMPATVQPANILALMTTFSNSHLVFEMAIVRALVERSHNVTVVSVLPMKSEFIVPNVTYIQLDRGTIDLRNVFAKSKPTGLQAIRQNMRMVEIMIHAMADTLEDPKMLELMHNKDNKFDLLLHSYLYADFFTGLSQYFKCPMALMWPNLPLPSIMRIFGNPLEIAYLPSTLLTAVSPGEGLAFRIKNLYAVLTEMLAIEIHYGYQKRVYEKHFPPGQYLPYKEAYKSVNMLLFSHHFTELPVRPLVPGLIEIGGIQLERKPNPLPEDIASFIDASEHGVILFCLGGNLKSHNLPNNTLNKIFNVLSQVPETVIWKSDPSEIPGNSSNILYREWVPQTDLLAHPKTKLLFGHGGKGGITEAQFHGVPILGLPLFVDQPSNMEQVIAKGFGLSIDAKTATEDSIRKTVKEILENPKYTNNVKAFSALYRDRPLSAKENAVYWLEYLIRHKGAPHLHSPLKRLSMVERMNLDILLIFLIIFYVIYKFLKYVVIFMWRLLSRKQKND